MQLSRLRSVYDASGPFATVYLEARSPGQDAPTQTRLRWQELRGRLVDAGATAGAIEAIDAGLRHEEAGEIQADGRVLVATDTGLALDAGWDAALGTGDAAYWTASPELGGYVRQEARSVRLLVAIAEQQGAVVRREIATSEHHIDDVAASTVEKETPHRVHKPRSQALAHNRIHRRVEESVRQDARAVVDHLNRVAPTFHPDVVVLAGEVQERTAIRGQLPPDLTDLCTEVSRGGTDDAAAEESLADELRRVASEYSTRRAAERGEQIQHASAHELSLEGADAVIQAAERGAVDTVLLDYETPASQEADVLRSCAATDAGADLSDTAMVENVGALLRFRLPAAEEAAG